MILTLSLGVIGLLAAVTALTQRQRARAAQDEADALRRTLARCQEEGTLALEQARGAHAAELSAALKSRDAAHASALKARDAAHTADMAAATRARDAAHTALERAKSQVLALRRGLQEASAERDRLAQTQEEEANARQTLAAQTEELTALKSRLQAADAELSRLRQELGRGASRALIARATELERRLEEQGHELERWRGKAVELEAERARREPAPGADLVSERDALRARVEALEEEGRQDRARRAALAVLGLPLAPRDAWPLSPERRAGTEATLRDTYIAASAAAALLAGPDGGQWARCGNPLVVERLAGSLTLLACADASLALGRTPQILSELYGVYGRHFVHLPGSGLALGLTGSRECPTLALRLAALRLSGSALPPAVEARPPELPLDPARSAVLDAWAARRGASAVALFGGGEPAGTDSGFAGASAPLVGVVQNLFIRAIRDGFAQGFSVLWRAEDDECLCARVLDDGVSVVFARFPSPPAPRVLDDLAAALRWAPAPLAAAS